MRRKKITNQTNDYFCKSNKYTIQDKFYSIGVKVFFEAEKKKKNVSEVEGRRASRKRKKSKKSKKKVKK